MYEAFAEATKAITSTCAARPVCQSWENMYPRSNKGVASFAYNALVAFYAPDCSRSWQNLL
jgi:hypothetical protein